jgi:hypothetical protein
MEPVEQIFICVQEKIDKLGDQIIVCAEQERAVSSQTGLPEETMTARIKAVRLMFESQMETAFGEGGGSIAEGIDAVVTQAAREPEPSTVARAHAAAGVWKRELPELRRFLEYCAGMITAHREEPDEEMRQCHKCLTQATIVLERISCMVEEEAGGFQPAH